jgi:arylsulfatase A-like enzyme
VRAFRGKLLLLVVLLPLAASSVTCGREVPAPAHAPQHLLKLPPDGTPPAIAAIEADGVTREALVSSARYNVYLPTRAVLAFSLAVRAPIGAETRGFVHLAVRADGKEAGERRINPRTERGFRDLTIEFTGPGRRGPLELELSLRNGRGERLPLPAGTTLAVADPLLLDVSGLKDRRGVILISIDTLRRDHVGLYGHEKPTSPAIDDLGRQGLVADDAVSVSSWTLPAHFSMVTSLEPSAHGAIDLDHTFNRRAPTLAVMFRQAGWLTQAITSHLYVSRQFGFDEGFDGFDYAFDRKAEEVADRAISFLDHAGPRPFFLFLHFYDAHLDYVPPEDSLRIMEPVPYTGEMAGTRASLFAHMNRAEIAPRDLAHILALYDAEIRHVDDQLRRVLAHLRDLGLEGTTLVTVTADHGEEFLDHGNWEHRATLYEELIRIPLIFKGPGIPAGQRLAAQTSLLDIAPTILDWARLPPLPSARGQSLLRPLPENREAYGETEFGAGSTRKRFLRGGASSWKTVLSFKVRDGTPAGEEWFDLGKDPLERRNAPPPKAAADALRARLIKRWQDAVRQGQGALPVDLSPEQIEQLRALGYIR